MPDLNFQVESAEAVPYAAAPLLALKLRVTDAAGQSNGSGRVHTVALRCQVRIETPRRKYTPAEQERLKDLFGEPARWGQTLKSTLWINISTMVPRFTGSTVVDLQLPCSFDFNVATTKYFDALEGGEIPLCLLFSGTIFHEGEDGSLQVGQISWEKETSYRLPVSVWKEMMSHYYPNSAWLCLRKDVFDQLNEFKTRNSIPTWEQALERPFGDGRGERSNMNHSMADKIARAVLYEGYILYPYRPSVKTRQRWTFGGLYPPAFSEAQEGTDPSAMQTQCLVSDDGRAIIEVQVRFLHLMDRAVGKLAEPVDEWDAGTEPAFTEVPSLDIDGKLYQPWQEASERAVLLPSLRLDDLTNRPFTFEFAFPASQTFEPIRRGSDGVVAVLVRRQQAVKGLIEVSAEALDAGFSPSPGTPGEGRDGVWSGESSAQAPSPSLPRSTGGGRTVPRRDGTYRLTVKISNQTQMEPAAVASRDEALVRSLVSTHTLLGIDGGRWISLTDPPAELRPAAEACRNVGAWPILVGEEGTADTLLSSPIILSDYPQIAPESPGDLFDSTEIDEILTLRIMTLTEEEKRAMAGIDPRAAAMLSRTESLGQEELMSLHGTIRTPNRGTS